MNNCLSNFKRMMVNFWSVKKNRIILGVILCVLLLVGVMIGINTTKQNTIKFADSDMYKNENLNLKQADNSITRNGENLQNYIQRNIDLEKSNIEQIKPVAVMNIKETLVEGSAYKDDVKLDDVVGDGNLDGYIGMYDRPCVLYNLDDNSSYYVGYMNNMDGQIKEVLFANNNYHGEIQNECIYDKNTGLTYVPKKLASEGCGDIQTQILCSVKSDSDGKVATNIDINLYDKNNKISSNKIAANALDVQFNLNIDNLKSDNVVVIANNEELITNACAYKDNILTIGISPCNISTIDIYENVENGGVKLNSTLSSGESMPMLPNNIFKLDDTVIAPVVGNFIVGGDQSVYFEEGTCSKYLSYLYGNNGFTTNSDMNTFKSVVWDGSGTLDVNSFSRVWKGGSTSSEEFNISLYSFSPCHYITSEKVAQQSTDCLALKCGHIGTPISHSDLDLKKRYRILMVNEKEGYVILGICSETHGYTTQAGCGIYKVYYESNGGFSVNKTSSADWSKTLPQYSFEGCEFTAYSDEACTQSSGVVITTDKNGNASSDLHALKKGTYYIKETKVSDSSNYKLNSEAKGKVDVSPNTITQVKWDNTGGTNYSYDSCINKPLQDPVTVKVAKCDQQTGEVEVPEGYGDFSNAQYEWCYYTSLFQKAEDIPQNRERRWVIKTDEKGYCIPSLGDKYKVEGDEFYRDEKGNIIFPIGTYVVREKTAPRGYEVSDIVYIVNVVADKSQVDGVSIHVYYGVTCDTWIDGVKVHHTAGEELNRGSSEMIVDGQTGEISVKAKEQVKRGDFKFDKAEKKDTEAQKRLSRVPFKLTSVTTGEWHVVVTDDNGEVNSENKACLHRTNENYFDCLLDTSGSVPVSGIDENKINSFYDEGKRAGVWFCWDNKTNKHVSATTAADEVAALPYDTYIIEELPVTKTKDYIMIKQEFTIDRENYTLDLGTLINTLKTNIVIETECSGLDGGKYIDVDKESWLNDRVRYSGLAQGEEYVLKSWVVRVDTQTRVSEERSTTFTADSSSGYLDVKMSVDTLKLVGKKLNCYEELYRDGVLVAQHKDTTDIFQCVTVKAPSISTSLVSGEDGSKLVSRAKEVSLVDTVNYTNLSEGESYKVNTKIVNKTTGDVIVDKTSTQVANADSGSWSIKVSANTLNLTKDTKLVCYEVVSQNDIVLCRHEDKEDENQTVTVKAPSISTSLVSGEDGSKLVPRAKEVSLVDTVNYTNLSEGESYKVNTKIVNKTTGDVIVDKTSTQVANADSGSWSIKVSANTLNLTKDTKLVCYEVVSQDDIVLCRHEDINDENQTVTVGDSSLKTLLHIKDDAAQVIPRSKSVTLIDEVEYFGLQENCEYEIKGLLKYENGDVFSTYNGSFRAEKKDGKTSIFYCVDTSDVADNTKLVSCIYVSIGGVEIVVHDDMTDEKESVRVVTSTIDISTEARSYLNNDKELFCVDDEGVIDKVSYHGAEGGYEYKLRARVIDKSTKQVYTPVNAVEGQDYVEKKFIAKPSGYGSEEVTILLDMRKVQARNLVVYEELYDHMGVCRAVHEDADDYSQSVDSNQPMIETDLYQKSDNSQILQRYVEQHLVDKVSYKNFAVGHDYVFTGKLMYKNEKGEVVPYINEVTNKEVTCSYTFRPQVREGSFDKLEYVFDSTLLPCDRELISYVYVQQAGGDLINHCVLDDTREIVKVVTPELKTKIYDPESGENWFIACRDKVICDDLTWKDLPLNRVNQVYTWLVNYDTGIPVTDGQISDDQAVNVVGDLVEALGGRIAQNNSANHPSRWESLFTSSTNKVNTEKLKKVDMNVLSHVAFGSVEVAVSEKTGVSPVTTTFNYGVTPSQKAVAMSVVVSENTVVGNHVDIEDKAEAIDIKRSEIKTTLNDVDDNKEVSNEGRVMLIDSIDYKNCIVGREYEMSGTLINKADGSVVASNKVKFVCDKIDGQVTMQFEVDMQKYIGCDLVAYEELYLDGDLACEHKDINDEGQTVHVKDTIISKLAKSIKTGDSYFWILLALIIVGSGICVFVVRNKIKNKNDKDNDMQLSDSESASEEDNEKQFKNEVDNTENNVEKKDKKS